ncbi:hypothetical protein FSP39_009775 [Pinctada imbricata]|uniref:Uncharacterized protein n=1 Tax=Pinctada imbricata TaxID=66713 RepID=A0AA88YLX4_PINIB|nr:hypothetical protein FSP39_009775 [Pinctada imbricata]
MTSNPPKDPKTEKESKSQTLLRGVFRENDRSYMSPTIGQKVWLFAVGGNRRPFNFIDKDGVLKGADLDLIHDGIMAGWFDACVAYVSSQDRVNAMDFTDPFRTVASTFAVLPGNPKGFDPKRISEFVVTHLNGAFTNLQCLERIGLGKPKKVIVASGIVEAKELMLNKTADALFSPRRAFDELDVLPGNYGCDINGTGMMVKKGSPLPGWWNPAFEHYYKSGAYSNMCENINKKYGGFPVKDCLPRPKYTEDGKLTFESVRG